MTDPRSYNSLTDPHLQDYFGSKLIRRHLRQAGLISRYGEIVPDKQYESGLNERSRREQLRVQLSRSIVERVIELERARQATVRRQFEMVAKRMVVENIRESRHQPRTTRPSDFISLGRPKTASPLRKPIVIQQTIIDSKRSPPRISSAYLSRAPPKTNSHTRFKSPTIKTVNENRCQVTMIYLGPQTMIDYDRQQFEAEGHQIIVMQQHCGGENLLVFKGTLQPNEALTFESRRHAEFPFALALYVNGLIDSRISVCCEYKHKQGVPLGGKRGSFAIQNVQGAQPCLRCRFNPIAKQLERPMTSTESTRYRTSIAPSSEVLLRTPSPHDEEEDDQSDSIPLKASTDPTTDNDTIIADRVENEDGQSDSIPLKASTDPTTDNDTIIADRVENEDDPNDKAREMYQILLSKVTDDLDWEQQAHLHYQLGNICKEGINDLERALEHYCISLEIRSQYVRPLDATLRNIYSTIGQILLSHHPNEHHTALDYFQRVLDIDRAAAEIDHQILANDYNTIGLILRDQGHLDESLFNFKQSLKHLPLANIKRVEQTNNLPVYNQKASESLTSNTYTDMAEVHLNIATTFQRLGQRENALKHAQKAVDMCESGHSRQDSYRNYLNILRNTH